MTDQQKNGNVPTLGLVAVMAGQSWQAFRQTVLERAEALGIEVPGLVSDDAKQLYMSGFFEAMHDEFVAQLQKKEVTSAHPE